MIRPSGNRIQVYDVDGRPVELCDFFQRSDIFAPGIAVGSHPGGTVAFPVAVVHFLDDGSFGEVRVTALKPWKSKRTETSGEGGEQ